MLARLLRFVRPHHGHKRLVVAAFTLATAVWAAGLIEFAARIPARIDDVHTRTDAIVILTGGSKRVEAGLALLAAGRARRVFVSGVHADVGVGDLIGLAPAGAPPLECCVEVGHHATNTHGNAVETAAWMRANGFSSLRLVTSSYHMPRSLTEFAIALPEAAVVPHPVFADDVKTDQWWKWPGTAALIVSEYNKVLLTRLRAAVAGVVSAENGGVRTAAR